MFEHEHPLNLIDLWSKRTLNYEEESDEDDDNDEKDFVTKPDFECECVQCGETIHWYHRYYYKCDHCPPYHYAIHKFCGQLPKTMEHPSHVSHTLILDRAYRESWCMWSCDICKKVHFGSELQYYCHVCNFKIDIKCATKCLRINLIHHPSHVHPLASIVGGKQILCECGACGKEHKGVFYQCVICSSSPSIHNDCVFLPKKLLIQKTTDDRFTHTHPLTLAYSFSKSYQRDKNYPNCRVCDISFSDNNWIYKCDKCRYYTHLTCATNRRESFMTILNSPGMEKLVKNYDDDEYPNLLQLPFPNESYSLLKHLFYKDTPSVTFETNDVIKTHVSHEHPLILVNVTEPTLFSRGKKVSYYNPKKKVQLLCNGCAKPITGPPFYMCANEDQNCDFVLHEWCTRLPVKVNDHPGHPHPLIYYPKIPSMVLDVFKCAMCKLPSNGFVYCCVECQYYVDVFCAFIPENITHKAHQNHLLSRVDARNVQCRMCKWYFFGFAFKCDVCNIHLHPNCALLVSETIRHPYDKHPMKLSYSPIENHKSDYICEICEKTHFDPQRVFYHCDECVQSAHVDCAPSILQPETHTLRDRSEFLNVKFGGIHNAAHVHEHPLSFLQESSGKCNHCRSLIHCKMIFKCLQCKFALHLECFLEIDARKACQ